MRAVLLCLTLLFAGSGASLAANPKPSISAAPAPDPAIAGALAASKAEVEAILAGDADAFGDGIADDAIVNSPLNTINRKAGTMGAFKAGMISYTAFDRRIDYAGKLGDLVVLMGEETIAPKDKAPNAGKIVHRRFTDIWRNDAGSWKLVLRQATIIKVE